MVVGAGQSARMISRYYRYYPEMGYEVSGFVVSNGDAANPYMVKDLGGLSRKGILGTVGDVVRIAGEERISMAVLTGFVEDKQWLVDTLERLSALGIDVNVVPDLFDIAPRHMTFDEVGSVPIIGFRDLPVVGWEAVAKRTLDIIGASVGLLLLSPLFLVTAIAIKLDSMGGVFFGQERIGQNGRPFRMYKFRSMVATAANGPPTKVKENDDRVTRVGKFIRKTSIDELPQLFNVLKGDMSLVGPRPETYLYVSQYERWHKRRLYLRPGITGLAQANGVRGNTSISDKTRYDIEYMERQSVWLDVKILFKTVFTVVFQREAY
jgi:exopolysaccharide biosynthesis polyprenyl glycosylphosphotransferase